MFRFKYRFASINSNFCQFQLEFGQSFIILFKVGHARAEMERIIEIFSIANRKEFLEEVPQGTFIHMMIILVKNGRIDQS